MRAWLKPPGAPPKYTCEAARQGRMPSVTQGGLGCTEGYRNATPRLTRHTAAWSLVEHTDACRAGTRSSAATCSGAGCSASIALWTAARRALPWRLHDPLLPPARSPLLRPRHASNTRRACATHGWFTGKCAASSTIASKCSAETWRHRSPTFRSGQQATRTTTRHTATFARQRHGWQRGQRTRIAPAPMCGATSARRATTRSSPSRVAGSSAMNWSTGTGGRRSNNTGARYASVAT